MAAILQRKAYEVMVLDGDASNPEGLVRLLFGLGVEGEPKPLIEYFGGINVVTCPVDDPSPLTRINDSRPIPENRIKFSQEITSEYYLRKHDAIAGREDRKVRTRLRWTSGEGGQGLYG
jgi:CO dehydrogenase maturation factor